MNFRGGCCIARYGGGGGAYDMSKVDRIMLRYRPIAPRPDSGGSCSPPVNSVSPKSRRGKRKLSNDKSSSNGAGSVNSDVNSKRCNRRRNEESKNRSEVVTLPLLPEPLERNEPPRVLAPRAESGAASLWLSFGDDGRYQTAKENLDLKSELITARTETVVSSLLTVECVTKGEYELGCTDEERRTNLERDTCPGFISDGSGRVIWTNGSYRELVVGEEEKCSSKMSVWLVMKEKPLLTQRTFTCRMRVQYTCRDKQVRSITSPCDVWKMKGGGFAWRLDVNAALCLGR